MVDNHHPDAPDDVCREAREAIEAGPHDDWAYAFGESLSSTGTQGATHFHCGEGSDQDAAPVEDSSPQRRTHTLLSLPPRTRSERRSGNVHHLRKRDHWQYAEDLLQRAMQEARLSEADAEKARKLNANPPHCPGETESAPPVTMTPTRGLRNRPGCSHARFLVSNVYRPWTRSVRNV